MGKSLEANGLELDSKLKDATSKLTLKELDISKARLKAADISLNLGREIDLLKQKLDINDAKVVSLDTALVKASAECELLIKELDKAKHKKTEEVSSKVIKEKKKINDATVKQKHVRSERTTAKKLKTKIEEKLQLAYTDEAEPSTEKKNKEKDPVKIVAKKKSPSPNKEATKVQTEELPTAEAPLNKETMVTKVKKTPKDLQKVSATNDTTPEIKMESDASKVLPKETPEKIDYTTLSKSALSRKTVKELREYLESKGLSITEDSGKPLKKNGLLEAVHSL